MFEEDLIDPQDLFGWNETRRNEALADPEVIFAGDHYRAELRTASLSGGADGDDSDALGPLEQPGEAVDLGGPTRANKDGTITVIASTEDLDRYNSRFTGWRLAPYRRNPIILYQHRSSSWYEDAHSVGAGKRVYLDDKSRLLGDLKFDEGEENKTGKLLGRQYREGFMFAVSIRARARRRTWMGDLPKEHKFYNPKGGICYEDNELIEISSVLIPGNSRAVMKRSLDGLSDQLPDWLKRLAPNGNLDHLVRSLGVVFVRSLIEQPLSLIHI